MEIKRASGTSDITGASMDVPIPRRRGRRWLAAAIALAVVLAGWMALRHLWPAGLRVSSADVRVVQVERGMFRDEVAVRAEAVPLTSVMLDSVESGRVEEVFARDGMAVQRGDLLFRLSNPQRNLDLLARQSERAQQISNLSNLRVGLEVSLADHRRRQTELAYNVTQAEKQHGREAALAARGFISAAALEESADRVVQQRRLLEEAREAGVTDLAIKRAAVLQMEQAIAGLDSGLQLVTASVDALAVKAPVAGRLTDFRLQVGETVRPDKHIGRIDDPDQFKLSAQIEEFYLQRVARGQQGVATVGGKAYPVSVATVYPQIKNGRFVAELVFGKEAPASLNPGQSMDTRLTLGEPAQTLLLPNGAFVNDSGGAWAFVVDRDGIAQRRAIRLGRRSTSQIEVLSGLTNGERVIVSSYASFGTAERLQIQP